ncbi:hypothetical protein BC629DRAFT_685174 [Irpex lacteus]|nr:hypothetical protein BC629DRAFT_685174 [Irpex lacteus]
MRIQKMTTQLEIGASNSPLHLPCKSSTPMRFIAVPTLKRAGITPRSRHSPTTMISSLDEETSQEGTDEASTDPETAVKGSEDNNAEYDESEENIDPVIVRADEVLLAPENEDDADDATAHGSSENSEEAEQLYDYDDADGEHFTQENYEQEEWDELEDPDADQTLADDAASSKQSSETLSTLSKRSRDDDDDGYEEEDTVEGSVAGSPGMSVMIALHNNGSHFLQVPSVFVRTSPVCGFAPRLDILTPCATSADGDFPIPATRGPDRPG